MDLAFPTHLRRLARPILAALAVTGAVACDGGDGATPAARSAGVGALALPDADARRAKLSPADRLAFEESYQRGLDALFEGNPAKTRGYFEACLKLLPADPDCNYQIAKILVMLENKPVEGLDLLERTHAAAPDHVNVGRMLGRLYHQANRTERAGRVWWDVLVAHPDLFDLWLPCARELGTSVFRLEGKDFTTKSTFEARVSLLARAMDSDPSDPEPVMLMGESYFGMGEFELAERWFKRAVTLYGNTGRVSAGAAWRSIAGARYWLKRPRDQVADALKQSIVGSPPEQQWGAKWALYALFHHANFGYQPVGYPKGVPEALRVSIRRPATPLLAGLAFADVSAAAGVAKVAGAGPSGWADVNGDGWPDLFASGCNTYSAMYFSNRDGTFRNVTKECGLLDLESGFGSLLIDYDNDGDKDLYVIRDGWFGPKADSLYRNDGKGNFQDVTVESKTGDRGCAFTGAYGDYDNDGHLDVVLAQGIVGDGSHNALLRNRGDGTFEDVTAKAGLTEKGDVRTIGVCFTDFDKDGDADVWFSGYYHPNRLYRNEGNGTFREVAKEAGVAGDKITSGFMALSFDLDNDTWPDLISTQYDLSYDSAMEEYLSNVPRHGAPGAVNRPRFHTQVYRNLGNGKFEEITKRAGFLSCGSMGATFGDLNNDGFVDVYFGTGGPMMDRYEPNTLYLNQGDRTFVESGAAVGVDDLGKGHGVTVADYDLDGDLDIYSPQGGMYHGDLWTFRLYRNDSKGLGHFTRIRLQGTKSNRDAVGARLHVTAGGRTQHREVQGGVGFGCTNPLDQHVGLGQATTIEKLTVDWPSGQKQQFTDLPADQLITIVEGEAQPKVGALRP